MRPIPKKLLIHNVKHWKDIKKDRWGNVELYIEEELKRVRIEPSSKIVRDKNNAEVQLAAELFYDCKNSEPKGVVFGLDEVIMFNGEKHKIQIVVPLYDRKKLHHYEIGLIKDA